MDPAVRVPGYGVQSQPARLALCCAVTVVDEMCEYYKSDEDTDHGPPPVHSPMGCQNASAAPLNIKTKSRDISVSVNGEGKVGE
jgi:hypothetical protein